MGFEEYAMAARFRDAVTKISEGVVNRMRPSPMVGEVYDYDEDTFSADIRLPGHSDTELIKVRFGPNMVPSLSVLQIEALADPLLVPDVVRVGGMPGSYYILDFVRGVPRHLRYEPLIVPPLDKIGLRANATQSIPNITWTKLDLLAVDHNEGDMTVSASVITVPEAGIYHANAGLFYNVSNNATERMLLVEYWTGADPGFAAATSIIRPGMSGAGTSMNPGLTGATDVTLPAGAKVRLITYQASGASLNIGTGSLASYLNLHRIP